MKVIFCPISSFYPYQNSGPALSMFGFCNALSDSEVEVTVMTRANNLNLDFYNLKADCFNQFKFGKVFYSTKKKLLYISSISTFFYMNKSKIDIVYLNSIFDVNNLPILILSILFNKIIIIAPRGELDSLALIYKKKLKVPFLLIYKIITSFSEKIYFHCTSLQEQNFSKNHFIKKNFFILPNFQDFYTFEIDDINCEHDYYLYIGRLDPKKGIENLIYAYKFYVSKAKNPKKLFIVGKGQATYSNSLVQLTKELDLTKNIFFLGFKKDKEKIKLYREAFFTVVPSFTENFANVVVESLSQATPVIASTGTPWNDLEKNVCGFWIDNNSNSLCEIFLFCDKIESKLYQKYRRNARLFFESHFSLESGREQWLNVINNLI